MICISLNTELNICVRMWENFRLKQVFIINNHFLDSFFIHALLTFKYFVLADIEKRFQTHNKYVYIATTSYEECVQNTRLIQNINLFIYIYT